ncbi:MAG: glycosyl hydrolase family 28-related protein [Planctomycetota bacterium]
MTAVAVAVAFVAGVATAEERVAFDSGGFETGFSVGDTPDATLVGQGEWSGAPGAGGDRLIVSRNSAIEGQASLRSLSAKKSAAAVQLTFGDVADAQDVVITFLVGNPGDDAGNAAVGLTRSPDALDLLGVHRVGNSNVFKAKAAVGNGDERDVVRSKSTAAGGVFEVELKIRRFAGDNNDHAAARFRNTSDANWTTLPFGALMSLDGFTNLGFDVPDEPWLYVAADGKNFRRAPRIDTLRVTLQSAPANAQLGPPPVSASSSAPEASPVSDGRFPDDAGVIDITMPPFNAVPNDAGDDTAAIQAALDAHPSGNRILYLPAGTYRLSDTLRWGSGGKGREQKRTTLLGAGREATILQLADSAPGFDGEKPKAVVWTGDKPAQRFRNGVADLTIDTGRDNPNASALQFNTSNGGFVRDVTLRSGDGSGFAGLDLSHTTEVGNGLVQGVHVKGFDHGVITRDRVNGMFFDGLRLQGQNIAGILNQQQVLAVRRLDSDNRVPAVINRDGGAVTLLDATLAGEGETAIKLDGGTAYVRSLDTTGYAVAIEGGGHRVSAGKLAEWSSSPAVAIGSAEMPSMPFRDAPDAPDVPLDAWVNPMSHGAAGDGKTDDTATLQRAVDAGPVVYLPAGLKFRVDGDLILRGDLVRLVSFGGGITGGGRIVVADGTAEVVHVENIEFGYGARRMELVHQARSLVVRHCMLPRVVGDSTGDLHLIDLSNHKWRESDRPMVELLRPGQNAYALNLNPENYGSEKIINRGANLVIVGLKTENHRTLIHTTAGRSDVLGAHVYAQNKAKTRPAFVVDDGASLLLAGVRQYTWKPTFFEDIVQATVHGRSVTKRRDELGNHVPLLRVAGD